MSTTLPPTRLPRLAAASLALALAAPAGATPTAPDAARPWHVVFVAPDARQALVLPADVVSFDRAEALTAEGWTEVWDSAPTAAAGYGYAAVEFGCRGPKGVAYDYPANAEGWKPVPLTTVPVTFKGAQRHVGRHHRHSLPQKGHKFSVGVEGPDGTLHGVVVVGQPRARALDNGRTAEVTRCCTDGVPNGCSQLYGAAWRAAQAMGYTRIVTYVLASESGTSLRAAGWRPVAQVAGKPWNAPGRGRPRSDAPATLADKVRWEQRVAWDAPASRG